MNFDKSETGFSDSCQSWRPIAPEHLNRLDDVKYLLSQNVSSTEKRSSEQKFYQVIALGNGNFFIVRSLINLIKGIYYNTIMIYDIITMIYDIITMIYDIIHLQIHDLCICSCESIEPLNDVTKFACSLTSAPLSRFYNNNNNFYSHDFSLYNNSQIL